MALGLTQPLTEISPRSLPERGGVKSGLLLRLTASPPSLSRQSGKIFSRVYSDWEEHYTRPSVRFKQLCWQWMDFCDASCWVDLLKCLSWIPFLVELGQK
jgi:hypothetical protein